MKKKMVLYFCVFVFFLQSLFAQNAYKGGKKDGVWNYYSSNQVLLARHFYNEGVKTGIWEFYDINGTLSWPARTALNAARIPFSWTFTSLMLWF